MTGDIDCRAVIKQLLSQGHDATGQAFSVHLNDLFLPDAFPHGPPSDRCSLFIHHEHAAFIVAFGECLLRDDDGVFFR